MVVSQRSVRKQMATVLALLVGLGAGFVMCRWLVRARPELASRLGFGGGLDRFAQMLPGHGVPAVDPAKMPDTLTPEEVEAGAAERLPDPELKRLIMLLPGWAPRRFKDEYRFHSAFESFLLQNGYSEGDVSYEQRVSWAAIEGSDERRQARPDFIIRDRVLVEIKRNLTISSQSDRSLGQMLRYLIAWAGRGPAVLLVCNEYDDNLRAMIQRHVRSWKAQGVPVMAYFVRSGLAEDPGADMPVS
jgi:hypothetical protein